MAEHQCNQLLIKPSEDIGYKALNRSLIISRIVPTTWRGSHKTFPCSCISIHPNMKDQRNINRTEHLPLQPILRRLQKVHFDHRAENNPNTTPHYRNTSHAKRTIKENMPSRIRIQTTQGEQVILHQTTQLTKTQSGVWELRYDSKQGTSMVLSNWNL